MKKHFLFYAAAALLLCQCDDSRDVYGWSGATPDDVNAMADYELEMIYNSLPPCGE